MHVVVVVCEQNSAIAMATQEESAPAAETTPQPESNEAAPAPAADDATATATDTPAAADAAPAAAEGAAAAAEAEPAAPPVIPRVVIVTGASSGLGLEASRVLCEAGHDVIMACRSEEKATRAIDKLKKQNLKGTLTYLHVRIYTLPAALQYIHIV